MNSNAIGKALAEAALFLLLTLPVYGIAVQSNGTGGGNWGDGTTWNAGTIPAITDDVTIVNGDTVDFGPLGLVENSSSVTIDVGGTLTIDGTGATVELLISGSGTVSNSGTISIAVAKGNLNLFGTGTVTNSGTINCAGAMRVGNTSAAGANATLQNNSAATINVNPGGFITILLGGSMINDGDLNLTGTAAVLAPPITEGLKNQGEFINSSGATVDLIRAALFNDTSLRFHNFGTIGIGTGALLLAADGVATNEPGGVINNTAGFLIIETLGATPATLLNRGTITNDATARLGGTTYSGALILGNTLDNADGAIFTNSAMGTVDIEDSAQIDNNGTFDNDGTTTIKAFGAFNNLGGTTINDGTFTNDALGVYSNGFCGTLTNNSVFSNIGELFNCGLIDGTTAITTVTAIITTSCGSSSAFSTLTVTVVEDGTLDPVTNARVVIEHVCAATGFEAYFVTINGSNQAEYLATGMEPAQYLVSVSAPNYETSASFLIVTPPLTAVIADVVLLPLVDTTATNTIELDVNFAGNPLFTRHVQLLDGGAVAPTPEVIFSGSRMILSNVPSGTYTLRVLATSFNIPVSGTFTLTGYDTERISLTATAARSARGGGLNFGLLDGKILRPPGSQAELLGSQVRLIDKQPEFDSISDLVIKDPIYEITINTVIDNKGIYVADVSAGTYFLVATTASGAILSEDIVSVTIMQDLTTQAPDILLAILDDDLDGDGIPNSFEISHGLNALDNSCPYGANHDLDNDGLTNFVEYFHFTQSNLGTRPNVSDSDGDTYWDGVETLAGSLPNNPGDVPLLLEEVFVRFDYTSSLVNCALVDFIQIGTQKEPFDSLAAGIAQVQNNGTVKVMNTGQAPSVSGPLTLGGPRPFTLTVSDPNGPSLLLGVP